MVLQNRAHVVREVVVGHRSLFVCPRKQKQSGHVGHAGLVGILCSRFLFLFVLPSAADVRCCCVVAGRDM